MRLTGSGFIFTIGGGDVNRTVIVDIDLGVGFFLQRADDLAAGADDGTDLVDGNLDGGDARHKVNAVQGAVPG